MALEKRKTDPALEFDLLRCMLDDAVLRVEFNNAPFNMLTAKCMCKLQRSCDRLALKLIGEVTDELDSVLDYVDTHPRVRAVILASALEDIFLTTPYEVGVAPLP